MQIEKDSSLQSNPVPSSKKSRVGIAAVITLLLVLLALIILPDPLMNWLVKPKLTEAFNSKHPAYSLRIGEIHYSVFRNQFGFDEIAIDALDSTLTSNISNVKVSGINWISLLWSRTVNSSNSGDLLVEIDSVAIVIAQQQYSLRCGPMSISASDSQIVIANLEYRPLLDDEDLFAVSAFRTTRYNLAVPEISIAGFDCVDLIRRENYRARSAELSDVALDVLINKDKPAAAPVFAPLMPNDLLALADAPLLVDSLSIANGKFTYGERFAVGAAPAVLTFDSAEVVAQGIANRGDSTATIDISAQAVFMDESPVEIRLSLPVADPQLQFSSSGSMGKLDCCLFNPFVEKTERLRIKKGDLEEASFDIDVVSGHASGTFRATYRDLSFAVIDGETGSEKGIVNSIASIISNTFRIRNSNSPEESGPMKVGQVDYTKKPDETFLRFAWLSLYSGVRDLVKK